MPRGPGSPKHTVIPLMSWHNLQTLRLLKEFQSCLKALTPYLDAFKDKSLFDEFWPTLSSAKASGHAGTQQVGGRN